MTNKPTLMFWIIAVVALLWNIVGCWNYIIQNDPSVVAQMPEVHQLIINNRPSWATAAFAISVFGGGVGSILLISRRKIAVGVFIISLLGTIVTAYFVYRIIGLDPATISALVMSLAMVGFAKISQQRCWIQ